MELENLLLRSHSGKILALAKAAKKKGFPLYPAKLDMMASMLTCWEEPTAPATLYFKKKPDGGLRPIFKYGVLRAAQQYLVLWVLAPRLRLHAGQYGVPGRDRTDAIEAAKKRIKEGYRWVIRGDIKSCYPSMNGKKVLERLPGPQAVLRQVILPPSEGHLIYPSEHAALVDEVRGGLPQGAASTPLVAAAALAPVLNELPDVAVVIVYVDDFAIFAASKAAAVETMNTLRKCLRAAPLGNLELKFCAMRHVSEGFGFLGYDILYEDSGGVIASPSPAAFKKLELQLDTVDAGLFPDTQAEKMARLSSWRCSHAAWDGDEFGDCVLIAILSHHFSGDLEGLVQLIHLRAKGTKEKRKEAAPIWGAM